MNEIVSWFHNRKRRELCLTTSRLPFYRIAREHLPPGGDGIIVDIGAGEGGFFEALETVAPDRFHPLDANPSTVQKLKEKFPHAASYRAPEPLPFRDRSVSLVHCSHLVEHLGSQELRRFLGEIDRVLDDGGVLVISAPLLWENFYGDLSHIRPYSPSVFIHYLCRQEAERSAASVSTSYTVCDLVYRYTSQSAGEWGSGYLPIDFLIALFRKGLELLRIRRYLRNGFTLVLKKRA